jgi:hypothetical protein
MENKEIIEKLVELRAKIQNKEGRLFFFVADTNGTPMASIEYIYKIAGIMHDEGYNVIMLHEKEKFVGVQNWMGEKYSSLKHISITTMNNNQEYQINGSDTFFIPELYSDLIKKLWETKLPSDTVVICQSHSFIFKYMNAGEGWSFYGVDHVITSSNKMKTFLSEYQPVKNVHIINPAIPDVFSPSTLPQKPIISIITRNQDDLERVAKLFYQKYPMYSWFSFKTLGNLPKESFAEAIKETCLSVWIDDYATFGTFPLESMKCGVPVIVKIPDLIPEWAETIEDGKIKLNDNAVYLSNILAIPDYIARFIENWLLGDVPQQMYDNMQKTAEPYSDENFINQTKATFNRIIESKIEKVNLTIKKYQDEQ